MKMELSNKLIQIQILKTDFKKMNRYAHFKMEYVNKDNFSNYENDLKQVTTYINEELTNWPEAPDYTEVLKRFDGESRCLIFYYNNLAIGWNWFNPNIALDWKTSIQELPENEVYGGGCYVTTLTDRPANAGMINYNMYFEYMLEILGYDVAYGYVEDWNRTAKRVNFANGATFKNFLK